MGNYRPKSLDELGNMYGKSMEADQEIKKGSSKLGTVKAPVSDDFSDEKTAEPVKVTPEQLAADEIASKVGDFARTFGSTGTGRAPASITAVQSRPRVPKKKPEPLPEDAGKSKNKRVPAQKEAKANLVRNTERTSLFDNYKSIMNDEDDSDLELEAGAKRERRRKKAEKKSKAKSAKSEEISGEVSAEADKAVTAVFGETKKEDGIAEAFIDESEAEAPVEEAAPKGNPVRRIIFTAILLVVLMLSVSVGGVKAFLKLNSDAVALGGYQLYSAEASYAGTSIGKGDLVFVENRQPSQGDIIAYRDSSGKYGFAAYGATLNSESMTVSGSTDKLVVFINEYRGAVIKTMPSLGGVLALITDYFHLIMAALFLVIGLLILLIIFSSKSKPEESSDEAEESEEADESVSEEADTLEDDPFEAFASGDPFEQYETEEEADVFEEEPSQETETPEEELKDDLSADGYMYDMSGEDE